MCQVNVLMPARRIYEIESHYQSPKHRRQDWNYWKKDCVNALMGKDAGVLHGDRRVAERENYLDWGFRRWTTGHRRPFHYDVVEGKLFVFTRVEVDRVRIQVQLLMTFLISGRHIWVLEDFWTKVGNLTDQAVPTPDLNSSLEHIIVSIHVTKIFWTKIWLIFECVP